MEAHFSGYATKAGLKCADGRTIMPEAFKHMDGKRVPLVWQHAHTEPSNILGHAILEAREDGVYAHGFFNETPSGQNAKALVKHGDIVSLSIFANRLVERGKQVFHGMIREVSLVLSGANPGALIDNVSIAHADGEIDTLDDEAIIYTGLALTHSEDFEDEEDDVDDDTDEQEDEESVDTIEHADNRTVKDVFDAFSEEQKNVVYFMIGAALEEAGKSNQAQHSENYDEDEDLSHQEGTNDMTRNVFEQNGIAEDGPTLSHDDIKTIVEDAQKIGSFKEAFENYALQHGIEDIDILFPDAKALSKTPDFISRRMEWVSDVLNGTKHSPFSRIKSIVADITADEARARGYVKGNLKKEEIIKLLKRVTTPTTIYKKQKLDRDDIIDITDLDVVSWLKAEMRLLLDEELARAVLIGDGREPDDEDKIDEDHLRPIAWDADMYSHKVTVQSNLDGHGIVESVLRARTFYKGTGTPTFYTTDAILTDLLLLKDKVGRRLYETEQSLAAAMRVSKIVVVEVMESTPDILGILVNLSDYTIGADKGGNVAMFDDFDIDYNQYKYLIETRVSGCLTKPKSAVVVKREAGTLVTPVSPSFDGETNTITIPTVEGVIYSINGVPVTGDVQIVETTDVEAAPDEGYSFPHNTNRDWTFVVA